MQLSTFYKRFPATLLLLAVVPAVTPVQAHQGNGNLDARAACAEQTLGNACEWTDLHHAKYLGSCRQVASSLLCVRNKPIVYPREQSTDTHGDKHQLNTQ